MRTFETGATRDTDQDKLDYEGFLSPRVLEEYAKYMHENRIQADGNLRDADNWQKGIPREQYMKSLFRHFMEAWGAHRKINDKDIKKALCAMLFNTMGYLFEQIKEDSKPNPNAMWGAGMQAVQNLTPSMWSGIRGHNMPEIVTQTPEPPPTQESFFQEMLRKMKAAA